jgi:hypothetical protein
MIDLKRNSKHELVPALGKRTRKSSIYKPNQTEDFKISRGRFSNFLSCERCFYMDRVLGFDAPGTPGWTLNETTDLLLKKEFDRARETQTPHRLFVDNGLDYLVPFKHPDMDNWRDSLHHGLMARFENTNIILTGGVDDIWQDTRSKKLIIADYKSQAKTKPIQPESYLSEPFKEGYKIQMDFYAFLLIQQGFEVEATSYFLVCNADRGVDGFYGNMSFQEALIPYSWNTDWIPKKVEEMIDLLNSTDVPASNRSCKNCAYSVRRAKFDKETD